MARKPKKPAVNQERKAHNAPDNTPKSAASGDSNGDLTGENVIRVDLNDQMEVRTVMEDELAGVLEEQIGLQPNFTPSNVKMILMTLTLVVGMVAHFVPNPNVETPVSNPVHGIAERFGRLTSFLWFDADTILGACVLLFFALQGILQLLQWTVERNYIYLSHASEGEFGRFPQLWFQSSMPKTNYNFTVRVVNKNNEEIASWHTTACKYFTGQGYFVEDKFKQDALAWVKDDLAPNCAEGKKRK